MNEHIFLPAEKQEEAKRYWLNKLSGELSDINLSGEKIKAIEFTKDYFVTNIDNDLSGRLIDFSNNKDSMLYIILLAAIKIMLYKLSGQKNIIICSPIYNLNYSSNIYSDNKYIPFRSILSDEMNIKELIKDLTETVSQGYVHQYYPIDKIIQFLGIDPDFSLYRIIIAFENIHKGNFINEIVDFPSNDLSFILVRQEMEMQCTVVYNSMLFKREIIQYFFKLYTFILEQILLNQTVQLKNISAVSMEERTKILNIFNNTQIEYPRDKCIHQIFEEQVVKTAGNKAVTFGEQYLTYQDLNEKSNQLARRLSEKGVKPNTIVGIMVKPSLEMVIGIIGILKAGGAYLPIDPLYPVSRINYMLEDAAVTILLTNYEIDQDIRFEGDIINITSHDLYRGPTHNLTATSKPKDLVYLIYTSGSTGFPKGTMIEHQGLMNYVWWANKIYVKGEKAVFPLYTSLAFDLTVTSIFTPLISGNEIIVYPNDEVEYVLYRIIRENKATIIKLTPSHLSLLVDQDYHNSVVRRFIVGGENLKTSLAYKIKRSFQENIEIFNEYGPTETVVGCMIYQYNIEADQGIAVPIGRPADNVQIYVLDKNLGFTPMGGIGEIYISGDGLARGYLNQPELTAEKFVTNPFITGKRMYKTGDLAKWLPDLNIAYLERIDGQLKIRGYRIEIEEIESVILDFDASIHEVVVAADQNGNNTTNLYAYLVLEGDLPITELKVYLSEKLPNYMIPNYFLKIDKIPVTINGKVDKKELLQYRQNVKSIEENSPPKNEVERILLDICIEVLGVKSLGVNQNFFHCGGDSIKAILVSAQLQKRNLTLELSKIFEYPIIRDFCTFININKKDIYQGIIEGEVKSTAFQQWFFTQNLADPHHYNQSVALYSKNGFIESAVKKVFEKIILHHDALRMVYKPCSLQFNKGVEGNQFDFIMADFINEEMYTEKIDIMAARLQSNINLELGPLVKLGLFKTISGDYLLIIIHHLVVDGISWRILLEDFISGYKQVINNEEIILPKKTDSFQEWAEKIQSYAKSPELSSELNYWKTIKSHLYTPLPKDWVISHRKLKEKKTLEIYLSVEETNQLLREVNKTYNTEINDNLIVALGLAVKDWTGANKIFINLEGHGREEIIKEINITRTIGCFTSIYPVCLDMSKSEDISYIIKYTKETLRHIPCKGINYGILKYLTLEYKKESETFMIEPEISFNYLGQFDSILKTDIFEIASIPIGPTISPENERQNALDITGIIVDERFKLSVDYNQNEYREETILKFMNNYKKYLLQVINHCIGKAYRELTPYDLGNEEISIEELKDIINVVDSID